MPRKQLIHSKHMHPLLPKHRAHGVIAADLPLIARILQVALFDVFPDFLHGLGAGELGCAYQ